MTSIIPRIKAVRAYAALLHEQQTYERRMSEARAELAAQGFNLPGDIDVVTNHIVNARVPYQPDLKATKEFVERWFAYEKQDAGLEDVNYTPMVGTVLYDPKGKYFYQFRGMLGNEQYLVGRARFFSDCKTCINADVVDRDFILKLKYIKDVTKIPGIWVFNENSEQPAYTVDLGFGSSVGGRQLNPPEQTPEEAITQLRDLLT